MSDILVSVTRSDEARVVALVAGLRRAGFSVWWHRQIPRGFNVHQATSRQLNSARCVVVVWSACSVGHEGEIVCEAAARAKSRGVLLPVLIDKVTEPIVTGETQAVDLVGWHGSLHDRRFKQLVATARSIVNCHRRLQPMTSVRRGRLTAALIGGLAMFAAGLAFVADVVGLQEQICLAPGVRAACATLGLGGVPSLREQTLWASIAPGDCESLRDYLRQFPDGALADEAERLLQAVEVVKEETWIPRAYRLPLTIRASLDPHASEAAARADALARAAGDANRTCEGFNGGEFRLLSSTAEAQVWRCVPRNHGITCGFDGQAVCWAEARHVEQQQVCKRE